MSRFATPAEIVGGTYQLAMLVAETQIVMTYRLLGMAGIWAVAGTENHRMVNEKGPAFLEASLAASRAAMLGRRPDEVMAAWVRPLRRTTRRNARRLGKRGPRLG